MIAHWIASLFALIAVLWTVLPLFRHDAWWIRVFDFPRVQAGTLTALALVAYVSVAGLHDPEDVLLAAVLSACIVFQLMRIAPYTPVYPRQVRSAPDSNTEHTLSLLVANVLTPNRNADALLGLIRERDPDVVLAVETDQWWQSRLDTLEADYPHTIKHPLDNLYGMHVYSRLALVDPQVLFLVEEEVPSMCADVVLRSGHRVRLHCLHPAPPSPMENPTSAERDAELLLVAKSIDEAGAGSAIVTGDLNDVAWSATTRLFQKVSGLLDPRIGRGMFSTFHAKYPFLRWPLDHVFCSGDFTLVTLVRLGYFGSDHFPIHAVVRHTPAAEAVHDEPRANSGDLEWAEEKLDAVDADRGALP